MPPKTKPGGEVNTRWFTDRLAANKMSMRGLARTLDLDVSAVSLMLRGMRKMTPEEANQIARILAVPVTEILRQAGVQVSDDSRTLPLRFTISAEGELKESKSKRPRMVNVPPDVPASGAAIQVTAPGRAYDGWILFAVPAGPNAELFIDRLVMAQDASGKAFVGLLKRGYQPGRFNVQSTFGGNQHADLDIKKLSIIAWINPA